MSNKINNVFFLKPTNQYFMKQLFLFLLLMLGSISYSLAQKSIKGIVTDPNGQAIIGANIIADDAPNIEAMGNLISNYQLKSNP